MNAPAWAKRGARCACASRVRSWTSNEDRARKIVGPAHGQVVTILDVHHLPHGVYLELAEWPTVGFNALAFRPVVGRTLAQDVATFKHHLAGLTVREVQHVGS